MFSPTDRATTYHALEKMRAGADEADRIAADADTAFARLVASNKVDALRGAAATTRRAADNLEVEWERLDALPVYATPAQVAGFLRTCGIVADTSLMAQEADTLRVSTAARETVSPSDGGPALWPPSRWPLWLKLSAALGAAAILSPWARALAAWAPRRKEAAP